MTRPLHREQRTSLWPVACGSAAVFLAIGFFLGQQSVEKACTTADCVRAQYGFANSLSEGEYSRARWIDTNETMLNVMQFHRGGFHVSYIDRSYPYMYSIDFWNSTNDSRVEVRVSDRRCFDDQRYRLDPVGCTTAYEGNLAIMP